MFHRDRVTERQKKKKERNKERSERKEFCKLIKTSKVHTGVRKII